MTYGQSIHKYTFESEDGGLSELHIQPNYFGRPEEHDVHWWTPNTGGSQMFSSISGKENIEDFIYKFALAGGLVKQGETLVVRTPLTTVVLPEAGDYRYIDSDGVGHYAKVTEDGEVLVGMQGPHAGFYGKLVDKTDEVKKALLVDSEILTPVLINEV